MQPLISIIIPIYNVEPYLDRCINSILVQTYTNIEIILVDDGSSDNSSKICEDFANKDERIVVIHKKNGGQAEARNLGIDVCKGDYISFVDSDDWVEPTYIDGLLKTVQKTDADIAICELKRVHSYENKKFTQKICLQNYTPIEAIRRLFSKREVSFIGPVCKIYKRHLFNNIRFPVGKFHEDEFFTYKVFSSATKIAYTSEILYYYYQRADSTMGKPHPYDLLEAEEEQFDFILKHDMADVQASQARLICWQILYIFSSSPNKQLSAKLRYYTKFLKMQDNPFVHYFMLKLFCCIPGLYSISRRFSPFLIRK